MLPAAAKDQRTSRPARARELRLLVADDDEAVRTHYVTLLEQIDGVGSVVAAADGVEAVQLARVAEFDLAVLDLNMPRLDGVKAAAAMAALQPAPAIAVHSSDPDALRGRADGLDLSLFDKLQFDGLVSWVAAEVARRRAPRPAARRLDLSCARCSYGVATDSPPLRCPMCGSETDWVAPRPAARADA